MVRVQVYYVAKQCSQKCTAEEYAIALGKHFVSTYPEVGVPLAGAFPRAASGLSKIRTQPAVSASAAARLRSAGDKGKDLGGAKAVAAGVDRWEGTRSRCVSCPRQVISSE